MISSSPLKVQQVDGLVDGHFYNDGAAKRFSVVSGAIARANRTNNVAPTQRYQTVVNESADDVRFEKPRLAFEDGDSEGLHQSVLREISPPTVFRARQATKVFFRIDEVSRSFPVL